MSPGTDGGWQRCCTDLKRSRLFLCASRSLPGNELNMNNDDFESQARNTGRLAAAREYAAEVA